MAVKKNFIILLLYVDDMLVIGGDASKIRELKKELSNAFAMKDIGAVRQILDMCITRDRGNRKLWLLQERYIEKVLQRFEMSTCKSVTSLLAGHFKLTCEQCPKNEKENEEMKNVLHASTIGSLMYAMVCTRLDIAHSVGVLNWFLSNPDKEHWAAVKWIPRYLRRTAKSCLCFGNSEPVLKAYIDADWAGDVNPRKSTSGYLVNFTGGAVSW